MRSINEYKRRFNTLLESKMGDVKPLISEAPQFEEFVVPTMDMLLDTDVISKPNSSNSKELNVKTSVSGNEFKITLPEGMYDSREMIKISLDIDKALMLVKGPNRLSNPLAVSNKGIIEMGLNYGSDSTEVLIYFLMPETQTELEEMLPFNSSLDVQCKNVKGGKIKFTVEVPSGSEIYEIKPVPTPTPNENYKPVPTPTYNPNYKG
jgi:hypothetical protein